MKRTTIEIGYGGAGSNGKTPWNFAVCVRGVEIPLLNPHEARLGDGRPAAFKPGLNGLCGRIKGLLFPAATERDHGNLMRSQVRDVTPAIHHRFIDTLTVGEVLEIWATYQGCLATWRDAVIESAAAAATEAYRRGIHRGGAEGTERQTDASGRPRQAMVRVRPGGRMPAHFGGHTVGAARTSADGRVLNGAKVPRGQGS